MRNLSRQIGLGAGERTVCKTVVSRLSKWRGAKLGLILKVPVAFQDLTQQDPAVPAFRAGPDPDKFTARQHRLRPAPATTPDQ